MFVHDVYAHAGVLGRGQVLAFLGEDVDAFGAADLPPVGGAGEDEAGWLFQVHFGRGVPVGLFVDEYLALGSNQEVFVREFEE